MIQKREMIKKKNMNNDTKNLQLTRINMVITKRNVKVF